MPSRANQLPPSPSDFDFESFVEGIEWHQRWEIFENVFTPGMNPVAEILGYLNVPRDLSGHRVLDIGPWNGSFSFECERRGASEVVALGPEDPDVIGFSRIRDAVGSTRTRYIRGSVYRLDPEEIGYFDTVLFCGVLYHLRYPLLGIDNVRRVCTGDVYIETFVFDNLYVGRNIRRSVRSLRNRALLSSAPYWRFYRLDELGDDDSNWFGPNTMAVVQAFESAGFETRLLERWSNRAAFHGRAKEGKAEFLKIRSTEGDYYDIVLSHLFNGASARSFDRE